MPQLVPFLNKTSKLNQFGIRNSLNLDTPILGNLSRHFSTSCRLNKTIDSSNLDSSYKATTKINSNNKNNVNKNIDNETKNLDDILENTSFIRSDEGIKKSLNLDYLEEGSENNGTDIFLSPMSSDTSENNTSAVEIVGNNFKDTSLPVETSLPFETATKENIDNLQSIMDKLNSLFIELYNSHYWILSDDAGILLLIALIFIFLSWLLMLIFKNYIIHSLYIISTSFFKYCFAYINSNLLDLIKLIFDIKNKIDDINAVKKLYKKSKSLLHDNSKNKDNYFLDKSIFDKFMKNILFYSIPNHLKSFWVFMAPPFDLNSRNAQKSFETLNNSSSRLENIYNTMLRNYNSLSLLSRTHHIAVYFNNNEFFMTIPNNLNIAQERQIRLSFNEFLAQIINANTALTGEMDYYNTAAEYLRRDGFNGELPGRTDFVNLGRQLYDNVFASFTSVDTETMQTLNFRHRIIDGLQSNLDRLENTISATLSYIDANGITLHQDSRGSLEIGSPINSSLDTSQAADYIENIDTEINNLFGIIHRSIVQLNNLESNFPTLNTSLRRSEYFTTIAARLQRLYTSRILLE